MHDDEQRRRRVENVVVIGLGPFVGGIIQILHTRPHRAPERAPLPISIAPRVMPRRRDFGESPAQYLARHAEKKHQIIANLWRALPPSATRSAQALRGFRFPRQQPPPASRKLRPT